MGTMDMVQRKRTKRRIMRCRRTVAPYIHIQGRQVCTETRNMPLITNDLHTQHGSNNRGICHSGFMNSSQPPSPHWFMWKRGGNSSSLLLFLMAAGRTRHQHYGSTLQNHLFCFQSIVLIHSLSLVYINCSQFECHHTWIANVQTRKSNLYTMGRGGISSRWGVSEIILFSLYLFIFPVSIPTSMTGKPIFWWLLKFWHDLLRSK